MGLQIEKKQNEIKHKFVSNFYILKVTVTMFFFLLGGINFVEAKNFTIYNTTNVNQPYFSVNGTNGYVGIGMTNPATLLQITNNNWISASNSAGTGVVNMFKVNASDQIEVGAPLNIGSFEFSPDSGLVTFADMPVSATPAIGTPEGYVFKVDGDNIMTLYSEANGAGGVQNKRVGIGTANPGYKLDVFQSVSGSAYINVGANSGAAGLKMTASTYPWTIEQRTDAKLYFNQNTHDFLTIDTGGYVGIGTTAPNDTFSIGNSGAAPAGSAATGHNYTSTYLSTDDYALTNYGLVKTLIAGGSGSSVGYWTMNGTNIYNSNAGNVGIGTTNPIAKLNVVTAAGTADAVFVTNTGGTGGLVLKPNWVVGYPSIQSIDITKGILINPEGGNVGIGTTGPTKILDVRGPDNMAAQMVLYKGSNLVATLGTGGSAPGDEEGVLQLHNNTGAIGIQIYAGGDSYLTGGNVGIGTTNPSTRLTVSKPIDSSTYGAGTQMIDFKSYYPGFDVDTIKASVYSGVSSQGVLDTQGGYLAFMTHGNTGGGLNEQMRIEKNGYIGIGTTAPASKLEVAGDVEAGVAGKLGFRYSVADGGMYSYITANGANPLTLVGGMYTSNGTIEAMRFSTRVGDVATPAMSILNSGSVGIGTTAPNDTFSIGNSGSAPAGSAATGHNYTSTYLSTDNYALTNYGLVKTLIAGGSGSSVGYWTMNGTNINNSNAGNVGIGTTNPGEKLEVSGNIRIATSSRLRWSDGKVRIGEYPTVTGTDGIGIGYAPNATGNQSISIGYNPTASNVATVAIGYNVTASGLNAINIGYSGNVSTNYGVNIGNVLYGTGNNGNAWFTGSVGIGTTSPVFKNQIAADMTMAADSLTDGSGQLALTGSTDANKRLDIGYDTSAATTNGFGFLQAGKKGTAWTNLALQPSGGNVGIGTTGPGAKLDIRVNSTNSRSVLITDTTGDGTGYPLITSNAGTTLFLDSAEGSIQVDANLIGSASNSLDLGSTGRYWRTSYIRDGYFSGNVGIGTTAPNDTFSIGNSGAAPAGSSATGHNFTSTYLSTDDYALTNYGLVKTLINSYLSTTTPITGAYLPLAGGTMNGAIQMGTNNITNVGTLTASKITASTFDPLYTINGVNYSTFAPAISGGVREEYIGKIKLEKKNKSGEFEAVINFAEVPAGSDLWLWRKVVEFNKDNIDIAITPYGGFAQVYYLIDGNHLIFRSDRSAEISYRLIGRRFDWRKWPSRSEDQTTKGVEIK